MALYLANLTSSQIHARYIVPARTGRIEALTVLEERLAFPNFWNEAKTVLKIFANFVNVDLIPSLNWKHWTPDVFQRIRRAELGIHGLIRALWIADGMEDESTQVVARILKPLVDSIARWLLFLLAYPLELPKGIASGPKRFERMTIVCMAADFLEDGRELAKLFGEMEASEQVLELVTRLWLIKHGCFGNDESKYALSSSRPHDEIWVGVGLSPDGEEVERRAGCPVIRIMYRIMRFPTFRSAWMKYFYTACQDSTLFGHAFDPSVTLANSITSRMCQTRDACEKRDHPISTVFKNLDELACLVVLLARPIDEEERTPTKATPTYPPSDLLKALHKINYLSLLAQSLSQMSDWAYEEERSKNFPQLSPTPMFLELEKYSYPFPPRRPHISICYRTAHLLLQQIDDYLRFALHFTSTFRTFARHGWMRVIMNMTLVWDAYPSRYRQGLFDKYGYQAPIEYTLRLMATHVVNYPGVIRSVRRALGEVPQRVWDILDEIMVGFKGPFKGTGTDEGLTWTVALQKLVVRMEEIHLACRKMWDQTICDNALHYTRSCDEEHPSENKGSKCSGCSSRVYCSTQCQKADWEHRHRQECMAYRELKQCVMDKAYIAYHHRNRSFHIEVLKELYITEGFFEQHLNQPHGAALLGTGDFPMWLRITPLLLTSPDSFSFLPFLDERYEKEFLGWAKECRMVEEGSSEEHGMTIHRLLEAQIRLGPTWFVILTVKTAITSFGGSKVEFKVFDTITRIGTEARVQQFVKQHRNRPSSTMD